MLGVSAPRIRQLVKEKKLPEPTKFGERASLWSRADVEALRFTQDGEGVVSERTSLMPTPAGPLLRVVDDVFISNRKRWGRNHIQIHVRIFQGPVEGVNRTVVIVSELPEGGSITNWIETVANEITARYLQGNTHAVTWIQTLFKGFAGPDYEYQVQNVTMRLVNDDLPHSGVQGFLDKITTFGRTSANNSEQPAGYHDPNWHPSSIEEVHRILGQSIEWYPLEGYSLREIEHWQRTGRPREVEVDPLGLKPVVDALETMNRIPRSHPYSRAARSLCPILANIAMIKDADDGRLTGQDSAGNFLKEREDYNVAAGITQSAAKLVPYRLVGEDSALAARHSTGPLTLPWELDTGEIADLYLELRAWKDETDKYSVDHDESLHEHITTVLGWLRSPALGDELDARQDIYPLGHIRGFDIAGTWDRAYVDSVDFSVKIDPANRILRMMHEHAGDGSSQNTMRYGYDPFGNFVADTNDPTWPMFWVYWPTIPKPIPLDGQIVADGQTGDRPAFVAKNGKIVGLLPQFPAFHHSGWNFGYGGGGPGRLAADIIEAINWQEKLPRESMPWRWVDDAVCHSDKDTLSVNIADIMRRLDTETTP
ncbi:hypothetical protein GCM10025779_28190 [Arthrobacter cryoconiti]